MPVEDLRCWRCGASLEDVPQPFARAAECPSCTVDLHVCKMCGFFDDDARRGCKEPVADEVTEKERSNFCGYFQPVLRTAPSASGTSQSDLEALFGMTPGSSGVSPSSADAARDELERLFGLDESSRN